MKPNTLIARTRTKGASLCLPALTHRVFRTAYDLAAKDQLARVRVRALRGRIVADDIDEFLWAAQKLVERQLATTAFWRTLTLSVSPAIAALLVLRLRPLLAPMATPPDSYIACAAATSVCVGRDEHSFDILPDLIEAPAPVLPTRWIRNWRARGAAA